MITDKKFFPLLILAVVALCAAGCKQKSQTEAGFVNEKILTTGMNTRVNGLEDLLFFSAQQALNTCQEDCEKLKEGVRAAEKEVAVMENLLIQRARVVNPPPPPCPCQAGNCLWERLAVFSYFVDLKKNTSLPNVSIQTLNGEVISSSDKATVLYSPEGDQIALVNLPQKEFKDEAVKMIISSGNGTAEVLVKIK